LTSSSRKSARFEESDEISLSCKFSGDPLPEIKWTLNGKEILDSSLTKIVTTTSNSEGTSSLTQKKASYDSIGAYRCTATNFVGSSHLTFTRRQQGKLQLDPYPFVALSLLNVTMTVNK